MAHDAGITRHERVDFQDLAITESGCPANNGSLALKTGSDIQSGIKLDAEN